MTKIGICDVCRLVDRNYTKKRVYYCDKCKAWICIDCQDKWFKRFKAMIWSYIEKLFPDNEKNVHKINKRVK